MNDRQREEWLSLARQRRKHLQDIVDRSHAAEADLLILEHYNEAAAQRRMLLEAMVALERVDMEIRHLSDGASQASE
jgi:nucleoid-associated protein YejK